MPCIDPKVGERLAEYAANLLQGEERRQLEDHLLSCDVCAEAFGMMALTLEAVEALPQAWVAEELWSTGQALLGQASWEDAAGTFRTLLRIAPEHQEAQEGLRQAEQRGQRGWTQVEEHFWRLTETIRIQVERARIHIQGLVEPLQWAPRLAAATRGQTHTEGGQSAPGVPGELTISLPLSGYTAHLLVTGTFRGAHLVVLGVVKDEVRVDGLEGGVRDISAGERYEPIVGDSGELDFDILPPGTYELQLSLRGESVVIPFAVQ